jgi:hypothetical protein
MTTQKLSTKLLVAVFLVVFLSSTFFLNYNVSPTKADYTGTNYAPATNFAVYDNYPSAYTSNTHRDYSITHGGNSYSLRLDPPNAVSAWEIDCAGITVAQNNHLYFAAWIKTENIANTNPPFNGARLGIDFYVNSLEYGWGIATDQYGNGYGVPTNTQNAQSGVTWRVQWGTDWTYVYWNITVPSGTFSYIEHDGAIRAITPRSISVALPWFDARDGIGSAWLSEPVFYVNPTGSVDTEGGEPVTDTVGGTSAGEIGNPENTLYVQPLTASSSGELQSIGINLNNNGGFFRLGIYAVLDGTPKATTLLWQSASTPCTPGWNDITVSEDTVNIVGSTTYYISVIGDSDAAYFYCNTDSDLKYEFRTYGAFPDPTGTLNSLSYTANMRITYATEVAPTTTPTPTASPTPTSTSTIISSNGVQYFFRSDSYTTLGVTGYGFDSDYTNTVQSINESYSGTNNVKYCFQAYLYASAIHGFELTSGPSANITVTGNYTGSVAGTVTIPRTIVTLGYEAIKINVMEQFGTGSLVTVATFVSPVLITDSIEASTWTFTLNIHQIQVGGTTNSSFSFGNSNFRSKVSDIVFGAPLNSEIQAWRLGRTDIVGFILASYMDEIGTGFYALLLVLFGGVLYFRYGHAGTISFFFILFGGSGGLIWILLPLWAAAPAAALIILGLTFTVWRIIR